MSNSISSTTTRGCWSCDSVPLQSAAHGYEHFGGSLLRNMRTVWWTRTTHCHQQSRTSRLPAVLGWCVGVQYHVVGFDGGLVHGNTVLPLSETHESKTTLSRKPRNIYKRDLYYYVADNLHIPIIIGLICSLLCPQRKTTKIHYLIIEGATHSTFSDTLQHPRQLRQQISGV